MQYLFILLLITQAGFNAFAQKKLVSMPYHTSTKNASINQHLQEISKSSGIVLEYSSANFDAGKMVRLTGEEKTIAEVLQTILHGQKIKLLEHNNKIILIPSAEIFSLPGFNKEQYNFYGYIKEYASKEPLAGATIFEHATQRGVASNNQGYFNLAFTTGQHLVEISYGGFKPVSLLLNIQGNIRKDISLVMINDTLSTVVVATDAAVKDGSVTVLHKKNYSNGLMNEDDPLQFLYLSPGLQNAAYSFSGFQVRGGGTDENLFLLDGNPVYNPTHLLGAISILNPTVLKSMRFYKSDFPARLGGSLSSVLDILTKQGNMNSWQGEINASPLAAALTLEGPLAKNKIALMVSGRKSIPFPFYDSLQNGIKSSFYDAHIKLSAIISPASKLFINFYTGEDQLRQTGKYTGNLHQWGNHTGSLQWNLLLGKKSFIHTSLNFSEYHNLASSQYLFYEKEEEEEIDDEVEEDLSLGTKFISSYASFKNYNAKTGAEIFVSKKIKINAGLKLEQNKTKPFEGKITNTEEEDEQGFLAFRPLQFEAMYSYAEAEIKIGRKFFVKPGLRASAYRMEDYNSWNLQPRFYMAYRIGPLFKLFASYSRMNQYLHLVINPYAGANRDMWVPSTKKLQPEWSEIYNIGFVFKQKNNWNISLDAYYKRLMNVTNYANGKSTFIHSDNWEQNIELGKGRSYGAEILINKTGKKLSFQGSYALAWSWRQFTSINNGNEFPYKYDHRHTANIGMRYSLTTRFDLSALWSFASGNVYTQGGIVFTDTLQAAPTGEELIEAYQFTYQYTQNNQYRANYFQRYDASLTFHSLKNKKAYASFKAGVYSINGSDNQYSYNLKGSLASKSIKLKTGTSEFKLIPYLSFTLKF